MNRCVFLLMTCLCAGQPAFAEITTELGAGNRYERVVARHALIDGLDAAEGARFQDRLLRIGEMFSSMAWVSDPPNGLCARLTVSPQDRTRVTLVTDRAMAIGSVSVLQPATFDGQKCTDLTNNGVSISINNFAGIFSTGQEVSLAGQTFYARPAIARQQGGVTVFADGSILVHRPDDSIFRPVTKERYLQALAADLQAAYGETESVETGGEYQRWLREEKPLLIEEMETQLAEMADYMDREDLAELRRSMEQSVQATDEALRAMEDELADMHAEADQAEAFQSHELAEVRRQLAALTPAQRVMPACASDDPFSAGPDECRDGTMIVEFDADFFDDAASGADLRLIRVSAGIGGLSRFRSESEHAFAQRIGIYRAIDLDLLQSMID